MYEFVGLVRTDFSLTVTSGFVALESPHSSSPDPVASPDHGTIYRECTPSPVTDSWQTVIVETADHHRSQFSLFRRPSPSLARLSR